MSEPSARLIYRKIVHSKDFYSLTEFEQLVFILLIVYSDDYGRLQGDIRGLKGLLLPASDRGVEDLQKAIANICLAGLTSWEPPKAIEIINFGKYQKKYHRRKLTNHLFSGEAIEGGILTKADDCQRIGSTLFTTEKKESPPHCDDNVLYTNQIKSKQTLLAEDKNSAPKPYALRTDPAAKIVYAIKMAYGVKIDDRKWDKADFGRNMKYAKELFDFFDGDEEKAIQCVVDIARDLNRNGLPWSGAAICRWKTRWLQHIERYGEYRGLKYTDPTETEKIR